MDKKKSYNSYIVCYCDKKQTIQLGWKLYGWGNVLVTYPLFVIAAVMVIVTLIAKDYTTAIILGFVLSIGGLNSIFAYRAMYLLMISAKHSNDCAKRVSARAIPYYGIYSHYKLMDEGKRK